MSVNLANREGSNSQRTGKTLPATNVRVTGTNARYKGRSATIRGGHEKPDDAETSDPTKNDSDSDKPDEE